MRETESAVTAQELIDETRKVSQLRTCLHPEASIELCSGSIIRAHSIARANALSSIARDGQVYGPKGHISDLVANNGVITEGRIGIRNASTFSGFCSKHDNQLFEVIDNQPFDFTIRQAALIGYRALCRELYGKRIQIATTNLSKILDRGKTPVAQQEIQSLALVAGVAAQCGLRDLEIHKSAYEDVIFQNQHRLEFYALRFDRLPEICCSGYASPPIDFYDNALQDFGDLEAVVESVAFSVLPVDTNQGAAVFTWIRTNEGICEQFIRSLHSIEPKSRPHAIRQMIFELTDNVYMSPVWWESLSDADRGRIRERFIAGAHHEGPDNTLLDDGLRVIDWKITEAVSSLAFDT